MCQQYRHCYMCAKDLTNGEVKIVIMTNDDPEVPLSMREKKPIELCLKCYDSIPWTKSSKVRKEPEWNDTHYKL